jgi:hypothetical protein
MERAAKSVKERLLSMSHFSSGLCRFAHEKNALLTLQLIAQKEKRL